ncbi:Ribosomal protein S18 acetylase RimI [Lentibacillus halodurans]|uniref:Ribosomal protein S18 acetylase RimI n=1 Tax=Lentibacillus halodurans TaxID=237679 RepID=A0A1I0YCA4_9BACI|nr:GNAT family N-acetyltransferase [Lentibacillus halodurans]SFB10999.1 Ribosomal protein S18 acetylase RimI [Lentibacillus halodurans]
MEHTSIYMMHDLKQLSSHPIPDGFEFCLLEREEEGKHWAEIAAATGEFQDISQALERFSTEFAAHLSEAKKRIIFLKTTDGRYAGTASAWFGKWNNDMIGRLHWVEIIPEFQGQKLGRPLITKALKLLSQYHDQAYLKTQPSSLTAIHIYLAIGFKPVTQTTGEELAWNHILNQLNKN